MKSKFYHMSACQVEVKVEENVFAEMVNVLHITEKNRVGASDMGQMQQKAGMTYINQLKLRGLDPTNVVIQNVVIMSISPLGAFTEQEWHDSLPESAKAAKAEEAKKPSLSVVGKEPTDEG